MKVTPRVYQRLATKAALKGLRSRLKRALVVLATGLGKTLAAAFIAKQFGAKRILFLVHNNFILDHAVDEFALVFDEKTRVAIFNGMSKGEVKKAQIVFATWQTIGNNLDLWARDYFDLIIVDEAHHAEAETYRPSIDYFTGAKLGITATPDREDEADIRNIFGPEVINISLEEAIARGWLPRIEYHVITDESLDEGVLQEIASEIRQGKKRFTMAEVNRRIFIKKRDKEIARIINEYSEKSIVFCASIQHAERMKKSLPLAAVFHSRAGNGHSDTWDKNQAVLGALNNGTIRRVCAVNAFNEGVNVPSVGLVAFCRVTGVLTIFRQQLGRGLRPGKEKLIVLDFVGNLERIQLVLEMMNRISDLHEQYTSEDDREREGYERQRFEVSGAGFKFTFSDNVVDLMRVLRHVDRDFYPTWQEASEATIRLKIKNGQEYSLHYRTDERLPSLPARFYKDFPGWETFLGVKGLRKLRSRNVIYPTWKKASTAAKKLKIQSSGDYAKRYKEDAKLPGSVYRAYKDFPGWSTFLGVQSPRDKYLTWQEASNAALRLNISTEREYRIDGRFKEDRRLPAQPDRSYKNFPGWAKFFRRKSLRGGARRIKKP